MQLQTRILIPLLLPLLALASACREDNPSVVEPEPAVTLPLDTTSHDFVWEYDTVGIQLSAIHGVAAVATDDIWVTGQFYRNDSLGKPDPRPIGNAAHWNGREWTMHTYNSMGRDSNYELWDAKAFGANNIWLCGGSPFRWDGVQWKRYPYKGFYFNSGISDIWSSQDQKHVCAVGYKRSLVLYSPEEDTFKWVDMPHDEHFYDVNGTDDGTIYVAGGNPNNGDSHIYRIDPDGTVNTWL
ncbi:MAG: hypothetical protein JXA28_04255, partial [Bacteroidetes bacterium]|nr:hypothetical protein [Bacteroidota bacterium]